MHTKGLQYKEDELQRLIIRPQPLVLTDEAEREAILLTVECDLQSGVKTSAQSIAAGEAEAKKLMLLNFQVPENIRRERRRRNPVKLGYLKSQGTALPRTNEAAVAPQPV